MIINEQTFINLNSFLLKISREYLIPNIGKVSNDDISVKSDFSKATKYDVLIEGLLLDYFRNIGFSSFICEESHPKNYINENSFITIDPIDGTRNFINGVNKIAVIISYVKDETLIFSVIFNPITEDFYHLYNGSLFKNFKLHNLSLPKRHIGSLSNIPKEDLTKYLKNYDSIKKSSCIGYDLIEVLEGNRTFMNIVKGKVWDIFPVIGILEELNFNKITSGSTNYKLSMSDYSYFYYAKI